jgi:hypothetical protein
MGFACPQWAHTRRRPFSNGTAPGNVGLGTGSRGCDPAWPACSLRSFPSRTTSEYREGLEAVGRNEVEIAFTHEVTDGLHAAIVCVRKPR